MLCERRQFWQQKPTVFCTLLLWLHAGYETECAVVGTNMTEFRLSIQCQRVAALDNSYYSNEIHTTASVYECARLCQDNASCLSVFIVTIDRREVNCVLSQVRYSCEQDLTPGGYQYAELVSATRDHGDLYLTLLVVHNEA